MRRLSALLLTVATACSSGGGTIPTLSVPEGEACTPATEIPINPDKSHVALGTVVEYSTVPATSGPHLGRWFDTGIYDEPVPDEVQVHNLEHGHVVVQHRQLDVEALSAIRAGVVADPRMMLLAPKPDMPWVLALTSWGWIQVCERAPDDPAETLRAFVAAHRDRAPESIP